MDWGEERGTKGKEVGLNVKVLAFGLSFFVGAAAPPATPAVTFFFPPPLSSIFVDDSSVEVFTFDEDEDEDEDDFASLKSLRFSGFDSTLLSTLPTLLLTMSL